MSGREEELVQINVHIKLLTERTDTIHIVLRLR